jgi:hypothetical protein
VSTTELPGGDTAAKSYMPPDGMLVAVNLGQVWARACVCGGWGAGQEGTHGGALAAGPMRARRVDRRVHRRLQHATRHTPHSRAPRAARARTSTTQTGRSTTPPRSRAARAGTRGCRPRRTARAGPCTTAPGAPRACRPP